MPDSGLDGVSSPESPSAAAGGVGGTGNSAVAAHLNDLLSAPPNSGTSQQPPRPHPARSPYEWIKRPNFAGRTPATKEGEMRQALRNQKNVRSDSQKGEKEFPQFTTNPFTFGAYVFGLSKSGQSPCSRLAGHTFTGLTITGNS